MALFLLLRGERCWATLSGHFHTGANRERANVLSSKLELPHWGVARESPF